jgi:hypothetical protein
MPAPPATAPSTAPSIGVPTPGSGEAGGTDPFRPHREDDDRATATTSASGSAAAIALGGAADAAAPVAPAPLPDTPPADVPAADLAAQLAEPLGHIDLRVDGDHEVTVRLDPAELGPVALRVRVEGGAVHVHLDAARSDTGHLLAQALPELRHALESAGIAAGGLQLGGAGIEPRDRHGRDGDPSDRRGRAGDPAPPSDVRRHQDAALPTRPLTAADGRVDLVL